MRLSLAGDRSTELLCLALITRTVYHGIRVVKGYFRWVSMQRLTDRLMDVDEDAGRDPSALLRPRRPAARACCGGTACSTLPRTCRSNPSRDRQSPRASGGDVRLRPDRSVRPLAAHDFAPSEGAARGGPRRVLASRHLGVLPRRARHARRTRSRADAVAPEPDRRGVRMAREK